MLVLQLWRCPVQGLVYEGRPTGRLTPQKLEFARSASEADRAPSGSSLLEAVQRLRPSALIGAAAKQGAFSADTVKALTQVGPACPPPLGVITLGITLHCCVSLQQLLAKSCYRSMPYLTREDSYWCGERPVPPTMQL